MEKQKEILTFYKYVSYGNDFLLFEETSLSKKEIVRLCKPHFGVGADGILFLKKEEDGYHLSIYNADGSKAKICGNGLKIVGAHLKRKIPELKSIDIYIQKEKYEITYAKDLVCVRLPFPTLLESKKEEALYQIGNFHRIFFSPYDEKKQERIARNHLEENITFYQVKGNQVTLRTYERGVGFTYSCGSASLCVAYHVFQLLRKHKTLEMITDGGTFQIEKRKGNLLLKGKVQFVFKGEYIK